MDGAARYYAVVTDVGNRLMAAAFAEEGKVPVTEIAVGDGGGAYYRPEPDQTALKRELWRGPVNSIRISSQADNVAVITGLLPGEAGGFTIREMAVFTPDGDMVAIANTPDTPKVTVTDGIIQELTLQMEVVLLNRNILQLMVDPSIVTATKQDIAEIWEYLHKTGRVFIGTEDADTQENDICIVVDSLPWPLNAGVYTRTETGERADITDGNGTPVIIK